MAGKSKSSPARQEARKLSRARSDARKKARREAQENSTMLNKARGVTAWELAKQVRAANRGADSDAGSGG